MAYFIHVLTLATAASLAQLRILSILTNVLECKDS